MKNQLWSLAGQRALVTGASRGIGLAIARMLAERGASVCLAARGRDSLIQSARELTEAGLEVWTVN